MKMKTIFILGLVLSYISSSTADTSCLGDCFYMTVDGDVLYFLLAFQDPSSSLYQSLWGKQKYDLHLDISGAGSLVDSDDKSTQFAEFSNICGNPPTIANNVNFPDNVQITSTDQGFCPMLGPPDPPQCAECFQFYSNGAGINMQLTLESSDENSKIYEGYFAGSADIPAGDYTLTCLTTQMKCELTDQNVNKYVTIWHDPGNDVCITSETNSVQLTSDKSYHSLTITECEKEEVEKDLVTECDDACFSLQFKVTDGFVTLSFEPTGQMFGGHPIYVSEGHFMDQIFGKEIHMIYSGNNEFAVLDLTQPEINQKTIMHFVSENSCPLNIHAWKYQHDYEDGGITLTENVCPVKTTAAPPPVGCPDPVFVDYEADLNLGPNECLQFDSHMEFGMESYNAQDGFMATFNVPSDLNCEEVVLECDEQFLLKKRDQLKIMFDKQSYKKYMGMNGPAKMMTTQRKGQFGVNFMALPRKPQMGMSGKNNYDKSQFGFSCTICTDKCTCE